MAKSGKLNGPSKGTNLAVSVKFYRCHHLGANCLVLWVYKLIVVLYSLLFNMDHI